MQCINKSYCSLIKRKNAYFGYLMTEGGMIRLLQLIMVVLVSSILIILYIAENSFTTMTYYVLISTNLSFLACLILFTIAVISFLVDSESYKWLHIFFGGVSTAMLVGQLSMIFYTFGERSSETFIMLIGAMLCQILINIYDCYFGKEIAKPSNKRDIFYFNGERNLQKFSNCEFSDTATKKSESFERGVDTRDKSSITGKENDSKTSKSEHEGTESDNGNKKVNTEEPQNSVNNKDETSEAGAKKSTSKSKHGEVKGKVNDGNVVTTTTKDSEPGDEASISQTKEPDKTTFVNKAEKLVETATVPLQDDELGETSTMSEKGKSGLSLTAVTARDEVLSNENTKEKTSNTSINALNKTEAKHSATTDVEKAKDSSLTDLVLSNENTKEKASDTTINALNKSEAKHSETTDVEKAKDGSLPNPSVNVDTKEGKISENAKRITCMSKPVEAPTNNPKAAKSST
ncbi:hypothetical protein Anas_07220 [Armadillidium nasatum]|uniref:MARVEL domain-containing protein n=1 Tax=Armadillidium nasatum TaxID=96803 RepID=A0A5N5TBU3_9CRUS|nr:hypothetical protein Anas_07220 [Armadillidium nasatum]